MTQKILYAVQSKQIEDVISRSLTAQTNGAIVSRLPGAGITVPKANGR